MARRNQLRVIISFFSLCFMTSLVSANPLILNQDNIPAPFSAQYQIIKSGMTMGKVKLELEQHSPVSWEYRSWMKAKGLAKLIIGGGKSRAVTHLRLHQGNFHPYLFEEIKSSGDGFRDQKIVFDWQAGRVQASYKAQHLDQTLPTNTFDNLSLQLSLMANVNQLAQVSVIHLANKRRLREYEIRKSEVLIEQALIGQVNSILLEQYRRDTEVLEIRIWLDPQRNGLPLMFERYKDGELQFTAHLISSSLLQ
ncbi:DUF3108 domain-containing protein [Gammaproteobacteria bacterium]|jgi:hypothetical protein|nr:DUF3108 domain-containing protein [Pseudomonadota bacterium]MDB0064467.1 DUF3108 domain-containing protein [Gammaproteobacteria bacterium]